MKKSLLVILLLTCFTLLHAQDTMTRNVDTSWDKIFYVVEQMPQYPGGEEAMMKFIQNHLIYPDDARNIGVQGKVVVGFVIMQDGKIDSIVIKKSVWPSIDAEALRVVRLLPTFKPGKQQGKAVRTSFLLPISMRLSGGEMDPLVRPGESPAEHRAVKAYSKENYEEALKLFKEVCERNPSNNFAAHNLAICLYRTGDRDGACTQSKKLADKGWHTADYLMSKFCNLE